MRALPFDYALEPLLQQARWQLEAALAELAAGARKLEVLKAAADSHRQHVAALLGWMKPSSAQSLDPVIARNRVAYLAQAARKTVNFERELAQAEEEVQRLQSICREKQLKLDAIERHRGDAEQEHRQAHARKEAGQADDDWLVRGHWVARQQGLAEAREESTT
ncbi:MAG: hypothetical protein KF892_09990 [Rhizobacter sp.]|nr:hypothetical protein [Rhizobacter sp.]